MKSPKGACEIWTENSLTDQVQSLEKYTGAGKPTHWFPIIEGFGRTIWQSKEVLMMQLKEAVEIKLKFLSPLYAENLMMSPSSISKSFLWATYCALNKYLI